MKMNDKESRFSTAYRGSLVIVLSQQILLGLLAGMCLDGGVLGMIFLYSLIAFWVGFVMIVSRRPNNPTKVDIFVIKWGSFLLFLISLVMSPLIWKLRGAM